MLLDLLYNLRIKLQLLIISTLILAQVHSQSESDFLKLANDNYKRGNFYEASKNYRLAWIKIDKDKDLLSQAGISSFKANDLDFAIRCFEKIIDPGNPYDKTTNWNLAKCYQHKNEFEKAIVSYKRYLRTAKDDDDQKSFIKNELLRCEEGIKYKRRSPLAIVESIGTSINTRMDEFAPVPDPLHNGNYYISVIRNDNLGGFRNDEGLNDTEHGRLRSDILYMKQVNGSWTLSRPSDSKLNSNMDDEVVGFLKGGTVIVFYRSWKNEKGTILVDTLNSEEIKLNNTPFKSPVISEIGDHAMSIFQDSLMIFSSCRTGGYGGYDLYLSILKNGEWSHAINLGATINSAFNEDYPFLSNDGLTLYYSSDNLKSMGGFDIFKTRYQPEAQLWITPANLGIPINSTGDDIYFHLTNDGLAGIFSSGRKVNNQGGQDIYFAYFKEDLTEQLTVSSGSPLCNILDQDAMVSEITPNENDGALNSNLKKEEQKNYFIESVYYQEEDFIRESKNQRILDKLVALLQLQADLKIQFIGHSYEESQDPVNLYFSIKKAEELEKYLVDKKISKSRISCIGLGSSLPIAKEEINRNKSVVAEKLNMRIEINIVQSDPDLVKINYAIPPIAESMKSDRPGNFRMLRTGLSYSLYLGESSSILNHPLVRFSEGLVFVEKNADENKYRYYFGLYKSFKEAEVALSKYQTLYKVYLEIKAFDSGVEMTRTKIIDHVLKDADLVLYLNYLNSSNKNKK